MASFGPWFGDSATISLTTAGGTDIPIGKLQSVELRIEAEETEYFSDDSTLREAVRHSEKVPVVTFTIGEWDVDFHRQWLSGGTDDNAATSIQDTTVPQKYDITAGVTPVDDNAQEWTVTVEGVTIPSFMFFSAERNEFIGNEYEGRGDDISIDQPPEVQV